MHISNALGASTAVCLAALAVAQPASAQDCPVEAADACEMTDVQVNALYACIETAMANACAQGENPVVESYRA